MWLSIDAPTFDNDCASEKCDMPIIAGHCDVPSSAIPLKRGVLRTRPLRGQSRYYPNFLGHDAEEWWSFDHSSASSKDHSPKPKIASRFSSTSIQLN